MSVNGDTWQLNLLNKLSLLLPGTYTVVVETLTHDSFRLSSTYVDALTIPPPPPTDPQDTGTKGEQEAEAPRSPRYTQAPSIIFPLEQFELPMSQSRPDTYAIDLDNKAPSFVTALYVILWWLLIVIGVALLVYCILFFIVKQRNNTDAS